MMKSALIILVVLSVSFACYVRLSPIAPDDWHVDPAIAPDPGGAGYRTTISVNGSPTEVLHVLETIAMQTPRTTLLAGPAQDGRITFVTRSRFWGFPDMTTIAVAPGGDETQATFLARSRFGTNDHGVNERRVTDWIAQLIDVDLQTQDAE